MTRRPGGDPDREQSSPRRAARHLQLRSPWLVARQSGDGQMQAKVMATLLDFAAQRLSWLSARFLMRLRRCGLCSGKPPIEPPVLFATRTARRMGRACQMTAARSDG